MVEQTVEITLVANLLLASALGALVGLERERHGQVAGMRTYALVACGAALFTAAGAAGVVGTRPSANVDPMRVAAQVVSGIGFIGAGAIIRDRGSVRGITTTAALWASAAVGIACGAGQAFIALSGAATVLLTLTALRAFRDRGLRRMLDRSQTVAVVYQRGHGTMAPFVAAIERGGGSIEGLSIDDDGDERTVVARVKAPRPAALADELAALGDLPEVESLDFAAHSAERPG